MAAAGPRPCSSSLSRMQPRESLLVISSSPEFPSICDLLPTKKPALRSGSNGAPIPRDAPAGFTSAAQVWQSPRVSNEHINVSSDPNALRSAAPAKPMVDTAAEVSFEPAVAAVDAGLRMEAGSKPAGAKRVTKKTEQSRCQNTRKGALTEVSAAETNLPKKSGRKPRSKKDSAVLAQSTLPQGKVTKPRAECGQPKRKAETVSRHFAPQISAPEAVPKLMADPIEDEVVILEPAMKRRLDWTPPRESLSTPRVVDTPAAKELPSSASPVRVNVFKNLQDTYGRPSETAILTEEDDSTGATTDVLGKRKLIEMVTTGGNRPETPEVSPSKPKAAKKKPRTITELATAAYRQPDEHTVLSDKPKQDTLLGYLDVTDGETAAAAKSEAKTAKMGRRPAKPKPKPAKTREEKRRPLLLSPASAMRQVARQDFVFGTASQLAAEDDPELLRALHEAMMVSNQADSDPFADSSPVKGRLALRRKPGSGLWAAGARGEDGDLIDLEVLDLTGSSPLPRDYSLPQAPSPSHKAAAQGPSTKETCIEIGSSDTSLDLSASPPFLHVRSSSPSVAPAGARISTASEGDKSSDHGQKHPPSAPREADFEPPPSNQEQHQFLLSQPKSLGQEELEPQPKPNFELYTDARLAKEVASYGFKPVKKRTAMIALLEQCWSSQHTRGLASRSAQAPMSTSSTKQTASPSRTRGRPRKNSAMSTSDVAEAPAPTKRGRKKSSSVTESEVEAPQAEKRPRGRPKKATAAAAANQSKAKAPASPKRSKSPPKPAAPAPATPKRRKAPAKEVVEIADSESDSDSDDPFASSPITSPDKQDDVFSPPAVDLSVTEDTETSLVASPTDQQVSLFRYITQAVVTAPRAKDPANPSWHEKMLMYDPIILEDLTAWLNSGQLDRVGYDGEVAPGDVKKWCESKSVCCLWRVSLNGKERKRF
ncbi:uncharacterized protein THITE_2120630 [Thermothielavioides terrestris NRRL 8126]|uniref:Structure-specific endonuclease subunit SLX4 n=1 Tax=Thermothielavioides terrestris (strain ATCC 38088 / NRRL 8126) TaxID=578455 RepID=G2RCY5_THETT|nr:uncharacterized protein THITE_2120630 [Thermothielavioides terrestris NRRL 8126]AEO69873.1 hypothetical protein THITE_2120630 [Thermothielavioides terrestris NRRL 8126]